MGSRSCPSTALVFVRASAGVLVRGWVLVLALCIVTAAGSSTDASESPRPVARIKPPPIKRIEKILYYPTEARQQGREGRVELEFNIGANGMVERVMVVLADDKALIADARELLAAVVFDVPAGWSSSGLEAVRYRVGMVYCLPPSGQNERFPDPVSTMTITAERIPGSPIRHPVHAGASGRCTLQH